MYFMKNFILRTLLFIIVLITLPIGGILFNALILLQVFQKDIVLRLFDFFTVPRKRYKSTLSTP